MRVGGLGLGGSCVENRLVQAAAETESQALAVSAGIAVLGVILELSFLPGTWRSAPPGAGTGETAVRTPRA